MLHSNFLYKACRNYSGGLSEPDLLGKSVLCYGKPRSGKTATVGVPFLDHAVRSGESVVLCVSDPAAYAPILDRAAADGYQIITPSACPVFAAPLSDAASLRRWQDFSDPLLAQLEDAPTVLTFPAADPDTVSNLDCLLLDLCAGDDPDHRVFLRRTVNVLIDAPFYNFADFALLMQSPGVRVCLIADSDIADAAIRVMHSDRIRSTPAGAALWRFLQDAQCESWAMDGLGVLMRCTQVVICTGISGISPQTHRDFVQAFVHSRKLSGRYLVAEELPTVLPPDLPIVTDPALASDFAGLPMDQRMDAQLRIIEQTITPGRWVAMQDGAVKTLYFHGLYVPVTFYKPDSAYAWLYAHLSANHLTNAVYAVENRSCAAVSAPMGDGVSTEIRIELVPSSALDTLRTAVLGEALELLEMDDALSTQPEDASDGSSQLARLEDLLSDDPLPEEPVNTCPEEYRYIPYVPPMDSAQPAPKSLPDAHVVFLGGHPNMVKKIRQIFPGWKYVFDDSTRHRTFDPDDIIFFWTAHASHKMMRYVFSRLPDTGNVRYVTATNIDLLIRQMEDLYNQRI